MRGSIRPNRIPSVPNLTVELWHSLRGRITAIVLAVMTDRVEQEICFRQKPVTEHPAVHVIAREFAHVVGNQSIQIGRQSPARS